MNGVRRKKRAESGEEDVLCCCEYINHKGERSHLAACLCDCEDLDEACDSWISCRSLQPEVLARAAQTALDRLRLPWIGGAQRVELSVVPAVVAVPVCVRVAALHVSLGVLILGSLPLLLIGYYRLTHRRRARTRLFLSLALFSLAYMYYNFVRQLFMQGHVGWAHLGVVTGGLTTTLLFLAKAKQDPGYLKQSASGAQGGVDRDDHRTEKDLLIAGKNWCNVCEAGRPARSGHCGICGSCVIRLDHHCVWINHCIGSWNHKSFILLLVAFMFSSVYAITITLGAVCRDQYVLSALFYCPGVYADYSTAFAFTCVWYCAIVTAGITYLLLVQLLNISYNVTEREARIALREKSGRTYLGGLVVDAGTYNQGLYHNWLHFLSLDSRSGGSELSDIV